MRKTILSVLALVGLLFVLTGGRAAQAAPAAQTQPTPRPDGSVVHIVQPGDTMWVIAVQYAQQLGKTPEDALPYLQELNNNPTFLNVGDEVIIIPAGATPTEPTPDPAATPEGTPAEATPTAEGAAPQPTAEGAPAEEAPAEPTAAPEPTAEPVVAAGSICVAAFDDANADGVRDAAEPLVPNAAIAIGRAGNTVSTYITDGASEPYCFELDEPDTYQLQVFPPAGFSPTTESSWAVAVANGEAYTVSFGLQSADAAGGGEAAPAPTEAAAEAETPADSSSGLFSNLGLVVVGVAGLLAALAIVGVILLRRG